MHMNVTNTPLSKRCSDTDAGVDVTADITETPVALDSSDTDENVTADIPEIPMAPCSCDADDEATTSESQRHCVDNDYKTTAASCDERHDTVKAIGSNRMLNAKRTRHCVASETAARIQKLLESVHSHDDDRRWRVLVQHVERVKSYAPHVEHVVFDLKCEPILSADKGSVATI